MHRFGVLVPSTNTTIETEYGRLLPASLQAHVARIPLLSSGAEATPRSGDADVDYKARLLGHAEVEVVALMQTAASLSADDYDDRITKRMRDAAGVPAITSAKAIGLAVGPGRTTDRPSSALSDGHDRQARTSLLHQSWSGKCRERDFLRHRFR
jgi:maleate cis-trans isomerase